MDRGPRAPVSVFDDPTPEPFSGTVGGVRFAPVDARAVLFPAAHRTDPAGLGALLVVLEGGACAPEGPAAVTRRVLLSLAVGEGAAPLRTGRYEIGLGGRAGSGPHAGALLLGAGDAPRPDLAAVSGWIDLEAVGAHRVAGAAVLRFEGGGLLSGWFEAARAPRPPRA